MFGLMTQQTTSVKHRVAPSQTHRPGNLIPYRPTGLPDKNKLWKKGIAFGSDFNGFAPQVSPRFGTEAAYFLQGDKNINPKIGTKDYETVRRQFAFSQEKEYAMMPASTPGITTVSSQPIFLTQEEKEIYGKQLLLQKVENFRCLATGWWPEALKEPVFNRKNTQPRRRICNQTRRWLSQLA